MWIPFTALIIGMLGMPEGEYAWSELPPLARVSLIVGGLFALASMALLIGAPIAGAAMNRETLRNGLLASARILEVSDTGTTINQNPLVRFLLEVRPGDRPVFQAETEKLVSRLLIPQFQPGASVSVRYDPKTRSVAILDEPPSAGSP
jgi:hypothetical protein